MRNCMDCFNLVAKIPLVPIQARTKFKTFRDIGIAYNKAKVECKAGMLTIEPQPAQQIKDKVFKNVLKITGYQNKAFNSAEKCAFFEGEDGE